MADSAVGVTDMDEREINEELLIQDVILRSLEDETSEDMMEARKDARKEVERLKAMLRRLRASQSAQVGEASSSGASNGSRTLSQGSAHSERDQGSSRVDYPDLSLWSTSKMSTPKKKSSGIPQSPSSATLPTRKREYASSSRDDPRVKSRRTTPTPSARAMDDPFSSQTSNRHSHFGDEVDIIDLTGDDVQADAAYVTEQLKLENRHEQEESDRKLALQLSSQDSPIAPRVKNEPSSGSGGDALSRLMATSRSNAWLPRASDWASAASAQSQPHTAPSPRDKFVVPGSYDAAWDDSGASAAAPRTPQPASASGRAGTSNDRTPVSASAGTPLPASMSQRARVSNNSFIPASALAASSASPGQAGTHVSSAPGMPGYNDGGSRLAMPQSSGNTNPLSDIITRASQFDFASGLDAYGNPMSDRVRDVLQDVVHDPRLTDQQLDDLLNNIDPDLDQLRGGTPQGLKSALFPHQEMALAWMKRMEEGSNKGGILADDMGLGKTISTLALILDRPSNKRPKTNLIIGPVSLIRQWEDEIKKKVKISHKLSTFIYHNCTASVDDLMRFDVVLTTYGTLASELKKLDKFLEMNDQREIDWRDTSICRKFPLLHPKRAIFYRIILDEAQCIKNAQTRTANASYQLKATYRWCLTGTPMMNGVKELYSLLRFLQIKPYWSWKEFCSHFGQLFGMKGDSRGVAMRRLRALLKATMLRRKKNSEIDGKPIVKLPEKTIHIDSVELSTDERDFYNQLESKAQIQFNKYLKAGTVGKNYKHILVLLLRLRQVCCHPHLNLDLEDATLVTDDMMLDLVKALDPSIVERLKQTEFDECPICYDQLYLPSFISTCGHDTCTDCLARIIDEAGLNAIREGNDAESNVQVTCPVCRAKFQKQGCFTLDAFRTVYMPETMEQQQPEQPNESADDDSDSEFESDDEDADDADSRGNLLGFVVPDDEDEEIEDEKPMKRRKAKTELAGGEKKVRPKRRSKGKKKREEIRPSMLKSLRLEARQSRKAYKKYMGYLKKNWLSSSKVTRCMELLQEIQKTGEKTIVFSQWTLLLDLLEVAIWHSKATYETLRYDGSMSSDQRSGAATQFHDNRNAKVMLVSLKAGNAGLNLTSASRVIIMDPFWNPYIEHQAIDRAYRIGQTRNVQVHRILTSNTIEDRIQELQKRKEDLVEAALDERQSMAIGRLSVNELRFLFRADQAEPAPGN